jgi:hypothetical protein
VEPVHDDDAEADRTNYYVIENLFLGVQSAAVPA